MGNPKHTKPTRTQSQKKTQRLNARTPRGSVNGASATKRAPRRSDKEANAMKRATRRERPHTKGDSHAQRVKGGSHAQHTKGGSHAQRVKGGSHAQRVNGGNRRKSDTTSTARAAANGHSRNRDKRQSRPNAASQRHSTSLAIIEEPLYFDAAITLARPKRERSRAETRFLTLALLLAMLLALVPTSFVTYSNTLALAKDGVAHLKNAEADFKALASSPTNLVLITDAERELQHAHDDFAQLQLRAALLSPAAILPHVGADVSAAGKLAPLAAAGTEAGILACDALKTLVAGLNDPLSASGGLTTDDMRQIVSDVDQIYALYWQVAPQIQRLTPSDLSLDPSLAPLLESLQARLPEATRLLDDLDGLAHAAPQLLGVGKPATYLVEVLDSSELRPTGGFIGNFGALTLDSGRLNPNFHISDITLIDSSVKFTSAPYQQFIPIPAKYRWLNAVFVNPTGNSWSLRDSNLDADYPTAARYALSLYSRLMPDAQKNLAAQGSALKLYDPAKSGAFAGVITLNLGLFQQALAITGPITISQFHQTVTASNFVSLIHSYALGPNSTGSDNKACGVTSCSKVFTNEVAQAFMAKVKSNLPLYIGKMGKLLYDSLRSKDVEVYFTAPQAQQMLSDLNLSATIAAPATGDSVFEVEANVAANKDNYFLQYQMADQISISQAGAATHHLTWSYRWPNNPATLNETFAAGGPDYYAYARVYTPPDATRLDQSGLMGFGSNVAFDRRVYYGAVSVGYDQTARYSLAWKVPNAVTHDSAGYHYHLIFQRQAGITWPLTLRVTLPSCATLTGAPVTSGLTAQNHVRMTGDSITITGPLTMDAQLTINYTCAPHSATLVGSA